MPEPIDSDLAGAFPEVSRRRRRRRPELRELAPVVLAVSAGGAVGAGARFEAFSLWPTPSAAFPATALWVNVIGSALIGLLMVSVEERWSHRRLVRPFWGTGVLGGFTTFSTYAVDVQRLTSPGHVWLAGAYLLLTPLAAVFATALTARSARRVFSRRVR